MHYIADIVYAAPRYKGSKIMMAATLHTHSDILSGRVDSAPSPSEHIDALVCGLPANERGGCLLMILQAYFDDSGSHKQSPLYAIGGFISTADKWKAFSEEWKAKLDEYPGLRYFKMSEAASLKGQFESGWTPTLRDQRVLEFAEIIKKHALACIDSWLVRDLFERTITRIFPDPEFNDPYFPCFYQVVVGTALYRIKYGGGECDLIFDEHGDLGNRVLRYWEMMKGEIPPEIENAKQREEMLKKTNKPIFRNDIKFMPLQAADLWAWLINEFRMSPDDHVLYDACRRTIAKLPVISHSWETEHLLELGAQLMINRAKLLGVWH